MANPVEATATTAGQLFSANRFRVPEFQRDYSWRVSEEVADYWRDVLTTIEDGTTHFLGLVIMTEEQSRMTIVDGQQRLLTTYLLARALHEEASELGRKLVANSLTDTFLYELDFATEERAPRVQLSSAGDYADLQSILEGSARSSGSLLVQAWQYLRDRVRLDLRKRDANLRLGQWAQHLNSGLQFAIFEHPDRNAAFKVYEVINTRGKELTPAELLKSYLIGTAGEKRRAEMVSRWTLIDDSLSPNEVTRFVRHAATLRHGYVIQRDLYQLLTRRYKTVDAVDEFADYLVGLLPDYQQLVEPTGDFTGTDSFARAAQILEFLGLATVRPLFLALSSVGAPEEAYTNALRVIVPRVLALSFGTGGIESRFATAARDIHTSQAWEKPIESLHDLKPAKEVFLDAITSGRPLSRWQMHVLRASALQQTALPNLEGGLHLIRVRYGLSWSQFSDEDFREFGNRLGNTVLLKTERRPHGSSSAAGALLRLANEFSQDEIVKEEDLANWSPLQVEQYEAKLASRAVKVWYEES